MDTNIKNYTVADLATILNLNDLSNTTEIIEKTNDYIKKYIKENDKKMIVFFQEMQDMLLDYSNNSNETELQVQDWITNEAISQNKNPIQKNKITERKQKINVFNDNHVPMNREHLGVSNTFNVDVAQDVLNPNLKNTYNRLVNLDSQFRQTSGARDISTDYTLDLSDPLDNVLSMQLHSIQIPYSWYTIDDAYSNRCFWINNKLNGVDYNISISIDPGNYFPISDFVIALTKSFTTAGFIFPVPIVPVSYNNNNAKLTLNLNGGIYTDPNNPTITFTISTTTTKLVFFDPSSNLQCANDNSCIPHTLYMNQTLGWLMGYRDANELVKTGGNIGQAVVDFNGARYFILVIDDYNQNHINNGLVGITEYSSHLKLPSYYSPDLPYICTPGKGLGTGQIEQLVPSAPRTLTNSQIYTINEIIKNNNNNANVKPKAPTTTDVFAIIPLKKDLPFGTIYVDYSGSLQLNKRVYFGPVNVDRMRIRLLDDKGNVVNLNGSEWSFTLMVEVLYQY